MRNTIRNRCSPRSTECFLILFMGLLVFGACDPGPSTEGRTAPSSTQTAQAYEKGAWQWRRHAEFNEIARRGDIDLVFLGDSITQHGQRPEKKSGTDITGDAKPPISALVVTAHSMCCGGLNMETLTVFIQRQSSC